MRSRWTSLSDTTGGYNPDPTAAATAGHPNGARDSSSTARLPRWYDHLSEIGERPGHVGWVEAVARNAVLRAFFVERPDSAAILGWRVAAPAGAARVGDAWLGGQDLLHHDVVPPVVAKVVDVHDLRLFRGGDLGERDRRFVAALGPV